MAREADKSLQEGGEGALTSLALAALDEAVLITVPGPDGDTVAYVSPGFRRCFGLDELPAPGDCAVEFMERLLATLDTPWAVRDDLERFWGNSRESRNDFLKQLRPEQRIIERSTTPLMDANGTFRGRLWTFKVASAEFEYRMSLRQQRQRWQWLLDYSRMLDESADSEQTAAQVNRLALEMNLSCITVLERLTDHDDACHPPEEQKPSLRAVAHCGAYTAEMHSLASELLWNLLEQQRPYEVLSVESDQLNSPVAQALADQGLASLYCLGRRVDAELRLILVVAAPEKGWSPSRDDLRLLESLLEIVHLYHARNLLARELASASRSSKAVQEARSSLVALLSHELRTPLHPLVGFTQLLLESAERLPEDARDMVERIAAGAQRLQELVDDLLTITRLDDRVSFCQKYACNLRNVVEDAVTASQLAAKEKSVEIVTNLQPDLPGLHADGAALRRAVRSLLSNAVRYSPEGSTVTVNASADTERIRICVEDQGQGIPEAQRESIFEPFVQGEPVLTRRHGGAGIGLTLVKRLAQSHGGQVWAEPAGEKGSRFILLLPRNPEKTL